MRDYLERRRNQARDCPNHGRVMRYAGAGYLAGVVLVIMFATPLSAFLGLLVLPIAGAIYGLTLRLQASEGERLAWRVYRKWHERVGLLKWHPDGDESNATASPELLRADPSHADDEDDARLVVSWRMGSGQVNRPPEDTAFLESWKLAQVIGGHSANVESITPSDRGPVVKSSISLRPLPFSRALLGVPEAPEAQFPVGWKAGGGLLYWKPQHGAGPHAIVAGATGTGKSNLLRMWVAAPTQWEEPWSVVVLDGKAGTPDFSVFRTGVWGERVTVLEDPQDCVAFMLGLVETIEYRLRLMSKLGPIVRLEHDDSRRFEQFANWRDIPADVRAKHARVDDDGKVVDSMNMTLVVIDELAIFAADGAMPPSPEAQWNGRPGANPIGGEVEFRRALTTATQIGRSVGVHIVAGTQRPDAALFGSGFARQNMTARIIGAAGAEKVSLEMVLGQRFPSEWESRQERVVGDVLWTGLDPKLGDMIGHAQVAPMHPVALSPPLDENGEVDERLWPNRLPPTEPIRVASSADDLRVAREVIEMTDTRQPHPVGVDDESGGTEFGGIGGWG